MNTQGLKKILILTYFFPPCNLTASQRSLGWAKYLKQFGYYPVIITRNWDWHIASPDDMHHDSGEQVVKQEHDGYEVWYVPFRGNLRDRLYSRYGKSRFNLLRKVLSFSEMLAHHFFTKAIPFSQLYDFARQYIAENPDVKAMIVSANPFEIFRFGFLLNRKFNIPWIADYRDDWNTSEINHSRGMADALLRVLERRSERRYMATAACITSVSPYYVNKIADFVKRPGQVILNGYFESDYAAFTGAELSEHFTVVYNGMLYPSQQIGIFIEAFKRFVDRNPEHRSKIRLKFPGIMFLKEVTESVKTQLKSYEDITEMSGRIAREEVLKIQASAHLMLMVSHAGSKGIPSSKIYEYLALGKPVLVCPGDDDILDETFKNYNLGFIANNTDEALRVLEQLFRQFLNGESKNNLPDLQYTRSFTRETQTQKLAAILDNIC